MITLAAAPLTTTFLIAIRLSALLLFSPIDAIRLLPIHVRLLVVMSVSMLIGANHTFPVPSTDDLSLFISGMAEFANGLLLALSLYATIAIMQIAGQLIDTQLGLNALAVLNPAIHSYELLSSRLLTMLATLFFFACNGHQQLLQGVSQSFALIAPGQFALFNGFTPIIQQFSWMFSCAFMLASPVVITLLIIDIASLLLMRNMPQMNIYFVTLPIKIMLGLLVILLSLTNLKPFMINIFNLFFNALKTVTS